MALRIIQRGSMLPIRLSLKGIPVQHYTNDVDDYKKTTINFLTQEQDVGVMFEAYSAVGFRLNTGMRILGPCTAFARSVLHWNVNSTADINEDSLSLFALLEPKIDILVLGIGERGTPVNRKIIKYLRSQKINVEILPTEQALATFNFLNSEKRYVAGAFIPPLYVPDRFTEQDVLETTFNMKGDKVFEMGDPFVAEPDTSGDKTGIELIEDGLEHAAKLREDHGAHNFWKYQVFRLPKSAEQEKREKDQVKNVPPKHE